MITNQVVQAEDVIKTIVKKINEKSENIKEWNQTIQFTFSDASVTYWIKITNGKVEGVGNKKRNDAVVTVPCSVETLQKIVDNKLSSVQALITRKVKVDGPLKVIRELRQKVLGEFKYN